MKFVRYCFYWGFGFLLLGCASLFGWDIHAPGLYSGAGIHQIQSQPQRVALYLPPAFYQAISKDRGGRFADPQTYHIGEAFAPMLLEVFQQGFEEFMFLEVEPTPEIMQQYAIPYLAVVHVTGFANRVDLKGQVVQVATETRVYDDKLELISRFATKGSSDAKGVFAKKGGPELNLNAALENNSSGIVQYFQDWLITYA